MSKNKNLEEGRNAAITLLNDAMLQMEEQFQASRDVTKDAYGKVNTRLAASEKQSFLDILASSNQAIDTIFSGLDKVSGTLGESYRQQQNILNQGRTQSRADIQAGTQEALQRSDQRTQEAIDQLQPYSQAGRQALSRYEAALQDPSLASNSPMAQYRKEQLESQLARELNARGIGQGGAPITQYYSPGYNQISAEESQNYFDRLNPIMQYGYGADTMSSRFLGNQGNLEAQLMASEGQNLSNTENRYATQLSEAERAHGNQLSTYQDNAYTNKANIEKRLGEQQVDLRNIYDARYANTQTGLAQALTNLNLGEAQANTNLNILKANTEQNYHQNKETFLDQINNVTNTYKNVMEPVAQMAGVATSLATGNPAPAMMAMNTTGGNNYGNYA